MNYIPIRIKQLRGIASSLGLSGSMYDIVKSMKEKPLQPSQRIQKEMVSILNDEAPEKLKFNIYKILHPNVAEDDINESDLSHVSLNDLSPTQLCNYFGLVFYGVSYVEKGNLILLKYNNCIYNTGWFRFAKRCRGIVLNADTLKVIGYPFNKFFNINERPEYSEAEVAERLLTATSISLSEKKDGTLISVYRDGDEVHINTNGSLDNDYINWAKALFLEKYPWFPHKVESGFTYIFELVIPETHCVIDYGDERTLYLIAIRNMHNERFLNYSQLAEFAEKNGLDITASEEFTSLGELVKKAQSMTNANKEGWVLKISNPHQDFFVKIKLSEYFTLHRLTSSISLKRVYNLYSQNQLHDYLDKANENIKADATELVEQIEIIREKYFSLVQEKALELAKKEGISLPIRDTKVLVDLVKKLGPSYEFLYLKGPNNLREALKRLPFKKFQEIMEAVQ